MRDLSSGSHVRPILDPDDEAVSLWKLLAVAALLVPPTAYVAGVMSSAADEPTTRQPLLLPGAPASVEPRVVLTRVPEPRGDDDAGPRSPAKDAIGSPDGQTAPPPPPPPPAPAGSPGRSDRDCDDDDDDGVDVIRPCPNDIDRDDRGERDDDDDDDDRDDGDDGGDDDGDDD